MKQDIEMKKVLWLEDQFEDLIDYASRLSRIDYLVDPVKSVSEALVRLQAERYDAYIFDLKILPGDDPHWLDLDERKRKDNPNFDPYLGVELLRFLHQARQEKSDLWQAMGFDFGRVIVFSVVNDNKVYDELESFGIPAEQILYKSSADLDTLANAIKEMDKGEGKEEQTADSLGIAHEPNTNR